MQPRPSVVWLLLAAGCAHGGGAPPAAPAAVAATKHEAKDSAMSDQARAFLKGLHDTPRDQQLDVVRELLDRFTGEVPEGGAGKVRDEALEAGLLDVMLEDLGSGDAATSQGAARDMLLFQIGYESWAPDVEFFMERVPDALDPDSTLIAGIVKVCQDKSELPDLLSSALTHLAFMEAPDALEPAKALLDHPDESVKYAAKGAVDALQ